MKLSNKKIIVSTLALAMGAALAGSISGSVAWYQYSTRASAVVNGVSAGVTGDLAVSIDNGSTYKRKAVSASEKYIPISASGTAGSNLTYYKHPTYQTAELPVLANPTADPGFGGGEVYAKDYQIKFRFLEDDDGAANAQTNAGDAVTTQNVFLTYFAIEGKFAPAVRVELTAAGGTKYLISANDAGETTVTKGQLDLNNDTRVDTDYWDCLDTVKVAAVAGSALAADAVFEDGVSYYTRAASAAGAGYHNDGTYAYTLSKVGDGVATADAADKYFPLTTEGVDGGSPITYVNKASTGEEYDTQEWAVGDGLVADATDPYDIDGNVLATTNPASSTLTMRVWLEGWAEIDGKTTWDASTIGQEFNINMQFACNALH